MAPSRIVSLILTALDPTLQMKELICLEPCSRPRGEWAGVQPALPTPKLTSSLQLVRSRRRAEWEEPERQTPPRFLTQRPRPWDPRPQPASNSQRGGGWNGHGSPASLLPPPGNPASSRVHIY